MRCFISLYLATQTEKEGPTTTNGRCAHLALSVAADPSLLCLWARRPGLRKQSRSIVQRRSGPPAIAANLRPGGALSRPMEIHCVSANGGWGRPLLTFASCVRAPIAPVHYPPPPPPPHLKPKPFQRESFRFISFRHFHILDSIDFKMDAGAPKLNCWRRSFSVVGTFSSPPLTFGLPLARH